MKRETTWKVLAVQMSSLLLLGVLAGLAGQVTLCVAAERGEKPTAWSEAEYVFVARLDRVTSGPVAQSFPPIYTNRLELTVSKVLRGDLKPGDKVTGMHSARQHVEPTFPEGKSCLVAASKARGAMRINRIEVADAERIEQVRQECSLPLGWKVVDGKPSSPWAVLGPKAWQAKMTMPAEGAKNLVDDALGRPALFVGQGVALTVAPVPPKVAIKWTNPDGDGLYRVTVSNTTDHEIAIPALLANDEGILWKESLVILCQKKAYPCPGAQGVKGSVHSVVLAPGAALTTDVNVLALRGPKWPRGGYRIEFQFCLGEKSQTVSFYYLSRHHDAIRTAATEDTDTE